MTATHINPHAPVNPQHITDSDYRRNHVVPRAAAAKRAVGVAKVKNLTSYAVLAISIAVAICVIALAYNN